MKNKISISGDLGSGKSVLAKKLTVYTGYQIISVGAIQRKLAQQYGMDTTTFNKYMENHPEIDIECDNMVKNYGLSEEPLILDSRLAWHFVPHSFKIHLLANKKIAAQRIYNDNIRENEKYKNVEETYLSMVERRKSEKMRFKQQYGVEIDNLLNYDLVIDTSYISPDQVFEKAKECFEKWKNNESYLKVWMSPKNLIPTQIAQESNEYECIKILHCDDKFFILSGMPKVAEALIKNRALISVELEQHDKVLQLSNTSIIREWETKYNIKFFN